MGQITIVDAKWIAPAVPEGLVLEGHSLVIEDDLIKDLLPSSDARARYPEGQTVSLPDHLLTPGFVNVHGHAAMTLLRGYADDRELMDWLNNHIWPVEGQLADADFVYDGTSLAVAEMISSGTTCAADTYFFPESSAKAFLDNHFRGQIAIPVIQFPNAWADSETTHLSKGIAFHNSVRHQPLITTAFAPHAPYTVTDQGFEQILMYANELELPIHLHLHETADEVNDAVNENGKRPFERMHELGVIASNLQAVHMTQMTESEIATAAQAGIGIAHCPESNMKLASGTCPVPELLRAGVTVGLGTDGAASNNNLDMIEEARSAALQAKLTTRNATALNAGQMLSMMTINGAKLLGLDDQIGSLEMGKAADVTAIDLSPLRSQPVHNPISQLIYTASGTQVTHTWIAGKLLLRDGQLTTFDTDRLTGRISYWQERMKAMN